MFRASVRFNSTAVALCVAAALLYSGCNTPGSSVNSTFISKYITKPNATTTVVSRSWAAVTDSTSDLGTGYGDTNNAAYNNETTWGAGARIVVAPAVATTAADTYLMAFSQFDAIITTPAAAQSVFLGSPLSIGTTSITWPQTMGGFEFMSADSATVYPWSFHSKIVPDETGAVMFSFLSSDTAADTATDDYDIRAWVRAANSTLWTGDSGGTSFAHAVQTAGTDSVHRASLGGMCSPKLVPDGAGGFVMAWCAADATVGGTHCESDHFVSGYTPFFGWAASASAELSDDATTYSTSLAHPTNAPCAAAGVLNVTLPGYASAVAPPVGAGVDFAFAPDGSGNGWMAGVVFVDATSDYSITGRYFDGSTRAFSATYPAATATTLIDPTGGDILFSPKVFTKDSTASFTLHYIQAAAAAATGDLMRREYNVDVDAATFTPAGVATVIESGLTFSHNRLGEYFEMSQAISPSGDYVVLAWVLDNEVHTVSYSSQTDAWSADITELQTPNAGDVQHVDVAVNDSGDAILVVAHESNVAGVAEFSAFSYTDSTASWSAATSGLLASSNVCQLGLARVSAAIDSSGAALAGITCVPAAGIARSHVVHYR